MRKGEFSFFCLLKGFPPFRLFFFSLFLTQLFARRAEQRASHTFNLFAYIFHSRSFLFSPRHDTFYYTEENIYLTRRKLFKNVFFSALVLLVWLVFGLAAIGVMDEWCQLVCAVNKMFEVRENIDSWRFFFVICEFFKEGFDWLGTFWYKR